MLSLIPMLTHCMEVAFYLVLWKATSLFVYLTRGLEIPGLRPLYGSI